MKNFFTNLLIFGAVLLINLQLIPATQAQTQTEVCYFMNYQYASVDENNIKVIPPPPANIFNDKLAVVTEERLGIADNKTSFDCVRQTSCAPQDDKTTATDKGKDAGEDALDAATSGDVDTAAQAVETGATPKTPSKRVVCSTTYAETCEGGSTQADIIAARKDPNSTYTVCEPVRIYISTTGSNLLYYYIGQIYRYAAGVGGLLAVLILIIAGIMRTTAGDNTNQITQANSLVTKSITGLIVLFLSAIILYTINPNFFVL